MYYESTGQPIEAVEFDYAAIDGEVEPAESLDDEFWRLQSEFFGEIMRWLTSPKTLAGQGARVSALALYLNPSLIKQTSLNQIERMKGGPGEGTLSKAMLEFQRKFDLKPSYYQKLIWCRDRFSRSAKAAHAERKAKQTKAESKSNQALMDEIKQLRDDNEWLRSELETITAWGYLDAQLRNAA